MDADIVYGLPGDVWTPYVVSEGGQLFLQLAQYANSGHTVGEFRFPVREEHLDAMRGSLPRHLLLRAALNVVCEHPGPSHAFEPDPTEADEAIDTVLLADEPLVEAWFRRNGLRIDNRRSLIAHGADGALLRQGRLFDALADVEPHGDWVRVDRDEGRAPRQ